MCSCAGTYSARRGVARFCAQVLVDGVYYETWLLRFNGWAGESFAKIMCIDDVLTSLRKGLTLAVRWVCQPCTTALDFELVQRIAIVNIFECCKSLSVLVRTCYT